MKLEEMDIIDSLEHASEIFELTEKLMEDMNAKPSIVVLGVMAFAMTKVIYGITSSRSDGYAALTVQCARIYEMLNIYYDSSEEDAEEATKQ